jgi:hypothetical protein
MSTSAICAHRRQVTARPDGAALADDRRHAAPEHLRQRLHDERPHAGSTLGEHVDPREHRGAHLLLGRRIAVAGGVAVDEVALEVARLLA